MSSDLIVRIHQAEYHPGLAVIENYLTKQSLQQLPMMSAESWLRGRKEAFFTASQGKNSLLIGNEMSKEMADKLLSK